MTTVQYPVPIQEDVRDILTELLGRGVAAEKTSKLALDAATPGLVSVYVTKEDEVGAVALCDVPFAVLAGAALVMVPAAAAKDRAREGDLADQDVEFTHEVTNVLARLLNTPSTPHLRLSGIHRSPGDLPADVAAVVTAPTARRDFVVTIEGYGEGKLSLLYT